MSNRKNCARNKFFSNRSLNLLIRPSKRWKEEKFPFPCQSGNDFRDFRDFHLGLLITMRSILLICSDLQFGGLLT